MDVQNTQLSIYERLYSTRASVRQEEAFRYFGESGENGINNPSHYPVLATTVTDGQVSIRALRDKSEILRLSDETKCVGQWGGQNRSDFFEFTALDYKRFVEICSKADKERREQEEQDKERRLANEAEERRQAELRARAKPGAPDPVRLEKMIRDALRILRNHETGTARPERKKSTASPE